MVNIACDLTELQFLVSNRSGQLIFICFSMINIRIENPVCSKIWLSKLDSNLYLLYFYPLIFTIEVMEEILVANKAETINSIRINLIKENLVSEKKVVNPIFDNIIAEGGEDFFQYLNWMGLVRDPNLMILSSIRHYYYDLNDFQGVNTLINLKMLNYLKHLDSFLCTLFRILPDKSNFVGYFKKDNSKNGSDVSNIHQPAKSARMFKNIFGSSVITRLSIKYVSMLLENHGFKVVDMTEINGLTYFVSKNIGSVRCNF